ncbi:MAG: hypothetical protein M0R74_18665 [Dehalococcoidia bacterium]|jgi:hypothetical protein|nr:hypothetical protein [Dehalococcoidia bacterium]
MTTIDMRGHIIAAYPGAGEVWRKKVLAMSDSKVLAIYRSLQKQGKVK